MLEDASLAAGPCFKNYNINAMNIPSKQAIVEVASTSGDRDILYSYVANENDHTVPHLLTFD